MTSKDIKDELVQDLEATDEEAESIKGGAAFGKEGKEGKEGKNLRHHVF